MQATFSALLMRARHDDPVVQLKRLKALYQQELITEEEHKTLRAAILEKL